MYVWNEFNEDELAPEDVERHVEGVLPHRGAHNHRSVRLRVFLQFYYNIGITLRGGQSYKSIQHKEDVNVNKNETCTLIKNNTCISISKYFGML